jgi:hypothetical protein
MPQPRALSQLQRTAKAPGGASGVTITRETVEAVSGNVYTIQGFQVPGTQVQADVGDQVDVLWQKGKPQRVLNHEVRRGSAHIVDDEGAQSIVEELFIAPNPKLASSVPDIYFRNDQQVTALGIGNDFATAPSSVFWGMNTDVFGVLAGSVVHVYRIDRPSLVKVLRKTAKIKVKLYSLDLLTAFSNLTVATLSFEWHRNTQAPYFKINYTAPLGPVVFDGVDTVRDKADMTRALTIKLNGITASFVEEVPGTYEATVTNTVESIIVDENNQTIIALSMKITGLGDVQSPGDSPVTNPNHNLTNATLDAQTFQFSDTTPRDIDTSYAPGVNDPVWSETDVQSPFLRRGINPKAVFERWITPTLDFRKYFRISEKHVLLLNASTNAVVKATIDAAPNPHAEEIYTGYRFSPGRGDEFADLRSFAFLFIEGQGATIGNDNFATWDLTTDAGNLGISGQTRSDGSLFTAGSALDIPTKRKMFKRDAVTFFSGLDGTHTTLNYEFNGQPISGGCATNLGSGGKVRVHWSATRQQAMDRYSVELTPQLFFSKGGTKYTFIKAIYRATHPGAGTYVDQAFSSFDPNADPHQIGVFVMVGTTVYKLLALQTVTNPDTPIVKLLTGNTHRVIFRFGNDWYMSNLNLPDPADATLRLTVKTGTNAGATTVIGDAHGPGLVLMTPDLLYDAIEEQRKFIKGWDRTTQAITLNQAAAGFPPAEAALTAVSTLINISKTLKDGSSSKNLHSIEDTTLLPKKLQETP